MFTSRFFSAPLMFLSWVQEARRKFSLLLLLLLLTAKIHSFLGNYSFLAICCMQQTGWTSTTWDRLQVSQEQPLAEDHWEMVDESFSFIIPWVGHVRHVPGVWLGLNPFCPHLEPAQ